VRAVRGDARRAALLEQHLRYNYEYSLAVTPPPKGLSPVEDFLFRSKKGYCEHYATAMVLMLRSVGIPARVVTGFLGGDSNTYGGYLIVRQSDAHSWVEALLEGQWRRFDPTPSVAMPGPGTYSLFWDSVKMKWSRYVVGYRPEDRSALFGLLTDGMGSLGRLTAQQERGQGRRILPSLSLVLLFCLLSALLLLLLKKRRRSPQQITAAYLKVRKALAGKGFVITAATTAAELEEQAAGYPFQQLLRDFHLAYGQARFGQGGDGKAVLQTAGRLLREIRGAEGHGAGS
jgi:hypothetical protein